MKSTLLLFVSFTFFFIAHSEFSRIRFPLKGSANNLYTHAEEFAWGDYNSDGYLDLAATLYDSSSDSPETIIYTNNLGDTSNFTELSSLSAAQVSGTAVAWGDFNGDKILDLFVGGDWNPYDPCDLGSTHPSTLYIGDGKGGFEPVFTFGNFCGVAVAVGDFNNDGRTDLVTIGGTRITNRIKPEAPDDLYAEANLWINLGSSKFEAVALPFFAYAGNGDLCVADYDGDGWLDLVYMGEFNNSRPTAVTVLLHNNASHISPGFVIAPSPFSQIGAGSCAWADFNNDGRMDLLLSGFFNDSAAKTELWSNLGNGTFEEINTDLPNSVFTTARWGDWDNDGLPDLCLLGVLTVINFFVLKNGNGTGSFPIELATPAGVPGACLWGDLNNDGYLDLFLNEYGSGSFFLVNNNTTPGSPPPPPTNVVYSFSDGILMVSWDAPTTASGPLTYEVDIEGVLSSLSLADGHRLLPVHGNAQNRLFLFIEGLDSSRGIKSVQVQSIDAAFRGSSFTSGTFSGSSRLSSFLMELLL